MLRDENLTIFDLPAFMFSNFPCVDFGGNLFGQWPAGIRFDIGREKVSRAVTIHDALFSSVPECILVSQEWSDDDGVQLGIDRFTPLFTTPGVFPNPIACQFRTVEVNPFDESPYTLRWARVPTNTFSPAPMYQAIANREHGEVPAIGHGVYAINDQAKVIVHMYDDRGLDVVAANLASLAPLYQTFGDWILDNQRRKIEMRFKELSSSSLL